MKKISIYLTETQIEALRLYAYYAGEEWTSAALIRAGIDTFIPPEFFNKARAIVTERVIVDMRKEGGNERISTD